MLQGFQKLLYNEPLSAYDEMQIHFGNTAGIARTLIVVVVIIVIIIAGAAVYFGIASNNNSTTSSSVVSSSTTSSQPPSSQSSNSISLSSGSSSSAATTTTSVPSSHPIATSSGSTSSSTSSSSVVSSNGSLVIDDNLWPNHGANDWASLVGSAYPAWPEAAAYQTLVAVNVTDEQQNGNIVYLPDLANNWTVSPNGETYTFNLRQGVSFSNGDPFNAYQAWTDYYMQYYLTANSSGFWSFGLNVFNTSKIDFGPATMSLMNQSSLASPSSNLLSIMSNTSWPLYATGPYTLVYNMTTPFPFFLSTLVGVNGPMMDATYILKNGGIGTPGTISTFFDTNAIPGTGPYVITKVVPQSYMTFQKNPNYWGKDLPAAQIAANPVLDPGHYNTIRVQYVQDDLTRYVDLTTGVAQISSIKSSNFPLITRNPDYGTVKMKYPALMTFLALNNHQFPTNITMVRQAIVHAINYSDLIQTAALGYAQRFMGPETTNYGNFYDPGNLPPYSYNVSLAEQDLVSAGYANGSGLPTLTFYVDNQGASWQVPGAEVIQSNLASIGIQVNIQVMTDGQFFAPAGNFQTNLQNSAQFGNLRFDDPSGYAPDYLGPTDYWVGFVTNMSGWGNFGNYNNPVVDQAVSFMIQNTNYTQIVQKLAVAEQQIYNDAPYAWLFECQLPLIDGSPSYNTHVVGGFYLDFNLIGASDIPLLNTVYPASS